MISDILYIAVALIGFLFSGLYLFKKRCMNYHIQALDKEWDSIPKEVRVLCLALMRVAGGGFLAMSISISYLVFNKVHNSFEENLMILIIGLACLLPTLWATLQVKKNTKGNPPVALCYIVVILLFAGFLTSLI